VTTHSPAEVIAKLGELTPAEIAQLFAEEGITGEVADARECPVARYVHQQTGVLVSIGAGHWLPQAAAGTAEALPENVETFVRLFDSVEWPHLIEEKEEL
jgi:hypothetical protein